jgi:hypothetical protein
MHPFRFRISLRFSGGEFDPVVLGQAIGLTPQYAREAGGVRKTPDGRLLGGTYESNFALFPMDAKKGEELHEAIKRISDTISEHRTTLNEVRGSGGRVELFVGWFSEGNTGDTFLFDLLETLGSLKIDLALDVYGSERLPSIEN